MSHWAGFVLKAPALPVYLPIALTSPDPNRLQEGRLKWLLTSSPILSHLPPSSLELEALPQSLSVCIHPTCSASLHYDVFSFQIGPDRAL